MSSATAADQPRFLLDESSFDFRGLDGSAIEEHLDRTNQCILELRHRGHLVAKFEDWDATLCLDDCELLDYLQQRERQLSPESARRFLSLLDKCPAWDIATPGVPDSVRIGDSTTETFAPTLGFALVTRIAGRGVACLVFGSTPRRGACELAGSAGRAGVFSFTECAELPPFWRSIYAVENVPEGRFFTLAPEAFPGLVCHPQLSFGKFEGSYLHVRDRVVEILGVLNDHFAAACKEHHGLPDKIRAALVPLGLDLSPESPNTHKSAKLMAKRDVQFGGTVYRCEWHAKLEPHRNRIHFTLPQASLQGQLLVGIFVRHLDT